MCPGIQGRLKGLSIILLYQGIMGNPSSHSRCIEKGELTQKNKKQGLR